MVVFIITGLPIKLYLYYIHYYSAKLTFWPRPISGCIDYEQSIRVRVRKCEQSRKSISHLPPEWEVSHLGLQKKFTVGGGMTSP